MQWRDLEERLCRLTMTDLDAASTGDTVELTPSGRPFVTSTDSDTHPMTPIRTGSGKISFITTDGFQILPTRSNQWRVVLTVDGQVMWLGWLKAESYNQRLHGVNEEVSINVISDTEALKTWSLDPELGFGMTTLRSLISECFDHLHLQTGEDALELEFSCDITPEGENFLDIFNFEVSRFNFFTENEEGYEGKTCFEVIESICKFFGWTLTSTPGGRMLFSYAGANQYSAISYADFKAGGTVGTDITPTTLSFESLQSCSMHDQTLEPGRRKISVKAEVNPVNNILPELGASASQVKWLHQFTVEYSRNNVAATMPWRVRLLEPNSKRITFPVYTPTGTIDISDVTPENFDRVGIYGLFPISHDYWAGPKEDPGSSETEDGKINYQWSDIFLFRSPNTGETNQPLLIAKGAGNCMFKNGGFEIAMNLHAQDSYDVNPGVNINPTGPNTGGVYGPIKRGWQIRDGGTNNARVTFSLRVGDKWWNGTTWTTERRTPNIVIWGQEAFQYNHEKCTKTLAMPFHSTHYAIPIDQPLYGELELQIYKVDYGTSGVYNQCLMSGFDFRYCEDETELELKDKPIEYSHTVDGWTDSLESVTLDLHSDHENPANYSLLHYQNTPITTIYDSLAGVVRRPEEALLDKMIHHFSGARKTVTLNVFESQDINPRNTISMDGSSYAILATASTNWRTGEAEILAEKLTT